MPPLCSLFYSILPSQHHPTVPRLRDFVWENAPRIRPFYLALSSLSGSPDPPRRSLNPCVEQESGQSPLLISMLRTLCDAHHLCKSASRWPKYQLSPAPRGLDLPCLCTIADPLARNLRRLSCRGLGPCTCDNTQPAAKMPHDGVPRLAAWAAPCMDDAPAVCG